MKTRKIISVTDASIDLARASKDPDLSGVSPLLKYIKSRDLKDIESYLQPGITPTYFEIKPLTSYIANHIRGLSCPVENKYTLAFMSGIESIDNIIDSDGIHHDHWIPSGKTDKGSYLTDEDTAIVSGAEIEEIGKVIWDLSFLPRHRRSTLQLSASCHAVLLAILP